jgi:thiosulfate/3-mercaptopyruvate sulfurtransferase
MPSHDPLIEVDDLKARLGAPDIRVVDATWFLPGDPRDARLTHVEGRIPGSVFFDIDEIADTLSPLPHMLPSPEKFSLRMRKLGIGDGATIIVYDALGLFSAARVWWTFRVMGKEDVFVLNGGLPAWRAAGYALDEGPPAKTQERHFTVRFRRELVRDLAQMRRAVDVGDTAIFDARPHGRFAGRDPEPRPGLRSGHMPGALNMPSSALVGGDGRMHDVEKLRALFDGLGRDLTGAIACSCGSGVTAAIIALALARLGRWDVPVYDGAWAEWGALADTPIVAEAR